MKIEFEAKFVVDVITILKKLEKLNATLVFKKRLFRRKIFSADFLPDNSWLRIRDEGDVVTLTLKSDEKTNKIDTVKELETKISDFEEMAKILEVIGLQQVFYAENYRELWKIDACVVSIDYWPGLSPFIEVEGDSEDDVKFVVEKLELCMKKAQFGTVFSMYEKIHGVTSKQMKKIESLTFENIGDLF